MKKFKFLILMLCSIIVIFATSCKDDVMGLKSPCMNHSDNNYYLSNLNFFMLYMSLKCY